MLKSALCQTYTNTHMYTCMDSAHKQPHITHVHTSSSCIFLVVAVLECLATEALFLELLSCLKWTWPLCLWVWGLCIAGENWENAWFGNTTTSS